nr:transposase [Bacillus sp. PK3_68]
MLSIKLSLILSYNRNKETVIQRLTEIDDRYGIEYVTIDMWKSYKNAVNTVLPHAKVVVDKLHVARMANQALDSVRKAMKSKPFVQFVYLGSCV